MEQVHSGPVRQAYFFLRFVFVIAPIVAGLDKFFHFLTDWNQYLSPFVSGFLGGHDSMFMMFVGVVEIVAGLGVLLKPKFFSYIVALWLALIIVNLLMLHSFYDVALRDLGLCLSALALGRLSQVCS